ncbi:hypothetical protein BDU57DRAFT_460428 [Ampelomyces quisqualis]|uniref:Uncharacterized protein n=1 Tax=Ampelomyces quisqualis TaxID=50730 RepID=A0A6A5QBQ0_AMPQU|nr:hypothetical protein BDU57DRAFT_460428 [Ampelomyces quisqualis]
MSPPLHAHLKRGLACDDLYAETDDAIEHVPLECSHTGDQVAKRQRVEEIASKYLLHGRLPVLLTASLRGPFDDGWRNPWAEANKGKRRSFNRQPGTGSIKTRGNGRDDGTQVRAVPAKRRTRSAALEMVEERGVASPETSRALSTSAADLHERHTPEEVGVPPATAPEPEENEASEVSSFSQRGNGEGQVPMGAASNDAASRPPESSSGFVYKKVGSTKWTISNAPRSKPRAVNFNSSPADKKNSTASSKSGTQVGKSAEKDAPRTTAAASKVAPRPDEPTQGSQADETAHDGQSMGSARHSTMSTQAAMVLAQLEFQESTFPSSSPRPWSPPPEATRRPMMPEPSPAMTPFSVFSAQLGQAQPAGSVLRGPAISTQDLFAAASPFAFSTVKKKAEVPQRSHLSMSMTSLDGHDDGGFAASPVGPTWFPERMPVKEKQGCSPNSSLHFTNGPNGKVDDA